jgi:hypothetical protein
LSALGSLMRAQKGHLGGQISPQSPLQRCPQENFMGQGLLHGSRLQNSKHW